MNRMACSRSLRISSQRPPATNLCVVEDEVRLARSKPSSSLRAVPNGQDTHSFDFLRQWLAAPGLRRIARQLPRQLRPRQLTKAIADWGREVEDLLACVDKAVALGVGADPNRLAVTGWSYGGILTDYRSMRPVRIVSKPESAEPALQIHVLLRSRRSRFSTTTSSVLLRNLSSIEDDCLLEIDKRVITPMLLGGSSIQTYPSSAASSGRLLPKL